MAQISHTSRSSSLQTPWHLCNRMMTKAKSKYLADVISENSDNPRRLWNSINNILHRIPPPALPEFISVKSLCDHFSRYFVDKIETIRSKFPDKVQNIPQVRKPEIRSKMNELKNYRPLSNLSFISKILEKIVANRLQAHIKNNHLSNPLQSAYRKHHSTESALLKVHNDIIISMDKGEVTALTLLDLSAAFDTIDHVTLTDRLSDLYGISGQAQIWFSSYLQNRHQSVKIEDTFSDKVTLSYGVPQGSVLGPVLFTLYTTPLSAIISSFDISHHLYADDTQIYMSLSVSNAK